MRILLDQTPVLFGDLAGFAVEGVEADLVEAVETGTTPPPASGSTAPARTSSCRSRTALLRPALDQDDFDRIKRLHLEQRRQRAQERLRLAHAELERRVAERTGELAEVNQQLLSQIAERWRAEQRLTHQALHDALTGLPNRGFLLDALGRSLARLQRDLQHRFAVLFLDLDRFKVVNDSLGHTAGNELLVEIAARLSRCVAPGDLVARRGTGAQPRHPVPVPAGHPGRRDLLGAHRPAMRARPGAVGLRPLPGRAAGGAAATAHRRGPGGRGQAPGRGVLEQLVAETPEESYDDHVQAPAPRRA